ncbi:MAG TPA: hypothetical protein DCR24_15050 [Bacillus bacterium]|nr:hypothetical protein [Bacillus sp. (in: firmicutes)]
MQIDLFKGPFRKPAAFAFMKFFLSILITIALKEQKKTEVKKGRTTLLQPMLTKYPITQFKPPVCFDAFYAT